MISSYSAPILEKFNENIIPEMRRKHAANHHEPAISPSSKGFFNHHRLDRPGILGSTFSSSSSSSGNSRPSTRRAKTPRCRVATFRLWLVISLSETQSESGHHRDMNPRVRSSSSVEPPNNTKQCPLRLSLLWDLLLWINKAPLNTTYHSII